MPAALRVAGLQQAPTLDIQQVLTPGASVIAGDADYTVTRRSPEEMAHRREMEKLKELHRQQLERWSWGAGLLLVIILVAGGFLVAFKGPDPERRKGALSLIIPSFVAFLSFLAGRGTQSTKGGEP